MSGVASTTRESSTHFEACGFWLPCDQANFIHHDRHKALRSSQDLVTFDRRKEADDLEDQVFHRLVMVLPDWGYVYAVPVRHVSNPYGDDPDAAVFVNLDFEGFRPGGPASGEEPVPVPEGVKLEGIALLVNSSGFYLWLLRYKMKDGYKHSQTVAHHVHDYLKAYIHEVVGGGFWSRYSGWLDDEQLASDAEKVETLEMYRRNHRGILTFFQINTVFEGLFSSSLDFQVFFYDNASDDIDITHIKQRYSLGRFIDLIAARVKWGDYNGGEPSSATPISEQVSEQPKDTTQPIAEEPARPSTKQADANPKQRHAAVRQFLADLNALFPHPPSAKPHGDANLGEEADHLCHNYLGAKGCGPLLLKFLQATASETLQAYKRRVERCRRALVGEIMEVTQRQEGVLQVEVPPTDKPVQLEGGFRVQDERILGVTEAQLRGYVLLLSAKLPLVRNVHLYIDGIVRNNHWYYQQYRPRGGALVEQKPAALEAERDRRSREVSAAIAMWVTLYTALESDLSGLENAIRQEREDHMVQEEEKIRVEQETLAEIQRLQERNAGSLSPQTSLTLGLLSNAFALASVLIALIGISQHLSNFPVPDPKRYHPADLIAFVGAVLGLGLALLALYFLAHYAFLLVFRLAVRFLRVQWSGRYYYELDIHMEAPLNDVLARDLLDDRYDPPSYSDPFIKKTIDAHPRAWLAKEGLKFWDLIFWPGFRKPARNSYRAEREDANEAMHKVYIEVTALFRRTRWYQLARPRVNLVLVYEILFHRPAQTPRFILKDLRVISMQTQVLPSERLAQIKRMIAVSFVNPLLTETARPLESDARIDPRSQRTVLRDALMSLTRPEPVLPSSPQQVSATGSDRGASTPPAHAISSIAPATEGTAPAVEQWSLRSWLRSCLGSAGRMLAIAGVVGFAIYLGSAVFGLIGLASANGFGALVSSDQVVGSLRIPRYVAFISANIWELLLGPLLIALTLAALASLAAIAGVRVMESIWDALTLTDVEASVKTQTLKARRRHVESSPEQASQRQENARRSQPVASRPKETAVSAEEASPSQEAGGNQTASSEAATPQLGRAVAEGAPVPRLSVPLRTWRRAVVVGWVALSWFGWVVGLLLKVARWVFRTLLASLGIALAIPVIGDLLALVGIGLGH